MKGQLVALLMILVVALGFSLADTRETVDSRLLRTVQIGAPQNISMSEIKKTVTDNKHDYLTYMLARSALLVLHESAAGENSFDELLDNALNIMVLGGNADQPAPGLAPGFAQKELVFTLVYAMVMSGNQEQAVNDLEKHLSTGSKYKQAVALQALRNIGTPRAIGLIQKYVEHGDQQNIAENTLADQDYPVLFELHDRWNMVPPAQRTRKQLTAIVNSGCDQRSAMAAYWLGFFPPDPDAKEEKAELDALRSVVQKNSPSCEMTEHVIAMKSLGLRSPESLDYWVSILRSNKNVWERHQAVLIAWSNFGAKFADAALDLLKTEPTQYIQWELMHGNLLTRKHARFRTRWDIWIPPTLQVYLSFYEGYQQPKLPEADVSHLLSWLESGARPRDPWVSNHLVYGLASYVKGPTTVRFLRLFNQWPKRNQSWWIIENLNDAQALPLLRYWSSLPTEDYQSQVIHTLVKRLESQSHSPDGAAQCCQPTRACLVRQVKTPSGSEVIRSEAEARAWLSQAKHGAPDDDVKIQFSDELKRVADVQLKDGPRQHWEYIYDCWHKTSSGQQ